MIFSVLSVKWTLFFWWVIVNIYCTQHEFLWPFRCFSRDFGRYFSKNDSCLALMAPRRLLRKRKQIYFNKLDNTTDKKKFCLTLVSFQQLLHISIPIQLEPMQPKPVLCLSQLHNARQRMLLGFLGICMDWQAIKTFGWIFQLTIKNLLLFQRIEPVINHLLRWWCAIFKWKITYSNALWFKLFDFVAWFAHTYNYADIVFL